MISIGNYASITCFKQPSIELVLKLISRESMVYKHNVALLAIYGNGPSSEDHLSFRNSAKINKNDI